MIDWLVGFFGSIDYSIVVFLALFTWLLYYNRKKLIIQKVASYALYMVLLRTKVGLKLMDTLSVKARRAVRIFGYVSIVLGIVGGIFIMFILIQNVVQILIEPSTPSGVAPVLPGMTFPGIGYLSFWHWVISIFILAVVHEFSHGVVARAHDIPVKSSGLAALCIGIPIIPAAFVEPDDKKLLKSSDAAQQSMFAAGPASNIILAFLILPFFIFVLLPWQTGMLDTDKVVLSPTPGNESFPSVQAGLVNDTRITFYNEEPVTNLTEFYRLIYNTTPGDTISIGNDNVTYQLQTITHPMSDEVAFLGVSIDTQLKSNVSQEMFDISEWVIMLFIWLQALNLGIGLFNLLPLGITDGGRMLHNLLSRYLPKKKAEIWTGRVTSFVVLIILFLLLKWFLELFGIM